MNTMFISKINANDDAVRIVEWLVADKSYIEIGASLVRVETSKVVVDIKAEFSGFVCQHYLPDDVVGIGEKLASFHESEVQCVANRASSPMVSSKSVENETYFSHAAKKYIVENEIDPAIFSDQGLLTLHAITQKIFPQKEKIVKDFVSNVPHQRIEKLSHRKKCEIKSLHDAKAHTLSSSLTVEFDSDPLRNELKKIRWLNGQVFPYILHVFSQLLKNHPKFTAFYADGFINYYDHIHLGIAVDIDKGLKVLVLPDANVLSLFELNMLLMESIGRYYDDTLEEKNVTGSTVTITDLSSHNIMYFHPLLNKKQSVILGIGGDSKQTGYPMSLTIVFDHQILSGKEIALFLNELKEKILDFKNVTNN